MKAKSLKASSRIFIAEITLSVIVFCISRVVLDQEVLSNLENIKQPLFDFNLAIVITFLISLVTNDAFRLDGNRLKRIARASALFFIVNSCFLIVSFYFDGHVVLIMGIITLGNLYKFWDITKNILNVI